MCIIFRDWVSIKYLYWPSARAHRDYFSPLMNYHTPYSALVFGETSQSVVAVFNGPWRSGVGTILLLAQYWWAARLCLSPPAPLSSPYTPSVSKLVRSDALPAHTWMQITQQWSFISNQTREAAEHPDPNRVAVSESSERLKECGQSAAPRYTILGDLPEKFASMQWEMSLNLISRKGYFCQVQSMEY